ncbi:DHA2 family multidrug resistance protein-like MFS transporter [Prauserella shujinwangii]|uniref:DHA2 family multidrug resistance protein-like MFS transporter n=1 Tax=Prauserella shujinwangii TaxID=1453103 RepID=A0A2T0M301_9PSEU|nr:MFS transporter [Prauserella shujinwangii]PRX51089.1 DHA2 family multidrug resistance protein-like MFS transporter [Prauserella shujinwangii]
MTGEVPVKAGRREWMGLAVLALPTFVVAIDLFVLLLALPSVAADLGADSVQQLWITDIYGFLLAGFTITMGTLGDRIGRRRLLMIGAVMFAVASLLCAFATSVGMLIAARALLGIAGGTLGPSTLALIGNIFQDPQQRATAFGVWGSVYTLGSLVGPVIGGAMLTQFWWGSVFLLGPPVMVLALVLGPRVLPEYRDSKAARLDVASVALSLASVLPIIYAIKEFARHGWAVRPGVALVIGLTAGVVFLRRQLNLSTPMLDLSLFRNRVIGSSLTGQLAFASFGAGFNLIMVLYLQQVTGMSTLEAGLAMVPGMVTAALGFQIYPKLAARFRPGNVIAVGLILEAIVLMSLTQLEATSGATFMIVGFALTAFGIATVGLGTNLVVGSAPPAKMGVAGSLAQLANEFGGMLGIALYGTLATVVYRTQMQDVIPTGVPVPSAATAGDSLAGATAVAGDLPAEQGEELLTVAREAFTSGVHVVVVVGAAIFAGVAALIARNLRNVPPFDRPQPAGRDEVPGEDEPVPDIA